MLRIVPISLLFILFSCTTRKDSRDAKDTKEKKDVKESIVNQEPKIVRWESEFETAKQNAQTYKRLLFVIMENEGDTAFKNTFLNTTLRDASLQSRLLNITLLRLKGETLVRIENKDAMLRDHFAKSFSEGGDTLLIFNFATEASNLHYGKIISALPLKLFPKFPQYDLNRIDVLTKILDLPIASVPERSLILAVRLHPEGAYSTDGYLSPYLTEEAIGTTKLQVDRDFQGHPDWDSRFQRIIAKQGSGYQAPYENAAESWPHNISFVSAALECVDSWKHSDGHWAATLWAWTDYAYHMRLNENGVWYCTGIYQQKRDAKKYPENLSQVLALKKGRQ